MGFTDKVQMDAAYCSVSPMLFVHAYRNRMMLRHNVHKKAEVFSTA